MAAEPVWAARPLLTDDARVVDPEHCQLESWTVGQTRAREWWALPACNVGGTLELAAGGQRVQESQATGATTGLTQAKKLLKELQPGGVGLAFSVGAVFDRDRSLPYVNMPVSWMSAGEGTLLHLNVGASARPERSGVDRTFGVGLEQQFSESAWLIAERYSTSPQQWQAQAGVRWWIVPNRLQVDATSGRQHEGVLTGRFTSVGLRWIFKAP